MNLKQGVFPLARMSKENMTKVSLKVLDSQLDKVVWTHFCYMDYMEYSKFLKGLDTSRADLVRWIRKWVNQDFNIDLSMSTKQDVDVVKALIKDKYNELFPGLALSDSIDSKGWTRYWLTEKMQKEIALNSRKGVKDDKNTSKN